MEYVANNPGAISSSSSCVRTACECKAKHIFPLENCKTCPLKKNFPPAARGGCRGREKIARARARARVVYIIYTISSHESLQYQGVFNKMEKYPRFLRFAAFYGIIPGFLRVLAFEKITEPTSRGKTTLRT